MAGLRGMDVVADIVLLATYFLYLFSTKGRKVNRGLVITLIVFLFYLVYSLFVAYNNTRGAITLDFLMQIRPYLTFFIVSQMAHTFSYSRKRLLKRLCFSMWIFFVPLGIYGLINPATFGSVVGSPANYVASVVFLSLLYLYCCRFSLNERLMFLLMLSVGLIVIHARFYGFFILACLILIYFYHPDRLRSKLRTGIAIVLILGATISISKSQITDYMHPQTVAVNDYDFAARSTLYQTAGMLLRDFFPLGSGFASFATYASKAHYSHIYSDYGLSFVNGLTPQEWFSASDSYYPSLAQFGIVGIILYLTFWGYIVWLAFSKLRKKGEVQPFIVALILISFVFIENISDSFFTSNKGVFMMMFLGILFSKPSAASVHRRRNKRFIPLETTQLTGVMAVPDATVEAAEHEDEKEAEIKSATDVEAEKTVTEPSVPPLPTQEVEDSEEPSDVLRGESAEDAETEDEYADFEEYCDDENETDDEAPEHKDIILPENRAAMQDAAIANEAVPTEEKTAPDGEEVYHANDIPVEAPQSQSGICAPESESPDETAPKNETFMEKEFQEVLEKLKSHTEEKCRLPAKEEAGDTRPAPDEKGDSERFDYII
jgi:hypothetical protein